MRRKIIDVAMGLFVVMVLVLAGCGGGGGGGGVVLDTTAPATVASPTGAAFGTVQNVTLSASEAATVYYSLDGTDPSIGGANTKSGVSPVNFQLGAGMTVLKFFAIDSAGNREAIKSTNFTIDLASPTISVTSPALTSFGLLTTKTLSWKSDETGTFIVELGGSGVIGSGLQIATGTATANTVVNQSIKGTQLSFTTPTPLWIYVTDQFGHTGSFSTNLSMKPLVTIPAGGELRTVAIRPDGKKVYVARTDNNTVAVIDTDPLSGTYNSIIATVPVGIRPSGIAVTPDGSRVYVTNQGSTSIDIDSVSVIATATDQVIATATLGSNTAPGGIAITTDGKRAYFTSFAGAIYILDTDPNSPTYNLITSTIPRPLLLFGEIAMTPDGKKGVVNWAGLTAHAVDVLDVDPLSPTFNTITATPVPIVSGVAGYVAASPDSAFAYASDVNNKLCKINLQTYTTLSYSGTLNLYGGIALTPGGLTLLQSNYNSTILHLLTTPDLNSLAEVDLGVNLGNYLLVTPDGTRAYVERNVLSANSEVVMVPLQ
ncbi:MAG: chitobiase/beta-hexosaminidase C-terminal domain-containing protein [Desulfuromonadaceae bacterium]